MPATTSTSTTTTSTSTTTTSTSTTSTSTTLRIVFYKEDSILEMRYREMQP